MSIDKMIIINGSLTPIVIYKDIVCVPYKKPSEKHLKGGPIYPDWENTFGRIYQFNKNNPIDEYPEFEEPVDVIAEPVGWGGVTHSNFGHFVTETCVSRIIPIIADFPDIKILIGIRPADRNRLMNWQFEILQYLGINKEQIIFLEKPILVKELYVAPQIEILNYGINDLANKEKYLEFLEELSSKKLVKRQEKLKVFVSRLFFPNKILGEKFLLDVFSQNGFQIVFPERLSIKEQLEIYYNSELIVFSEESAIHGLQLLGKLDATVIILNRRKHLNLGQNHISIRVKNYKYINCVLIKKTEARTPSILDIRCLEDNLSELGINLDYKSLLKDYYFNVISDIIEFYLWHKYSERPVLYEALKNFLSQLEDLDKDSFIFLQEALKNIEKFYESFILSRYKDGLGGQEK